MSDNESIEAGLRTREESPVTTGPFDGEDTSLKKFAKGPKNLAELEALAVTAEQIDQKFDAFISMRLDEIEKASKKISDEWNGQTSLSRDERKRVAEAKIAEVKKAFLANTGTERFAMVGELKGIADNTQAVAELYRSPLTLMVAHGWSDPEAGRFIIMLAGSGASELKLAEQQAVNTSNKALAAAVAARYEGMSDSNQRLSGVSRAKLAEILFGGEWKRAQAALTACQNRFRESLERNRSFQLGKGNNLNTITNALNRRAEARFKS